MVEDAKPADPEPPKPDVHQSLAALGQAFVMLGNAILAIPQGPVGGGKKVKREKKDKSDKVKRPASAYNMFVKENSSTLRESGKYQGQKEVMQALGRAWKDLSPAGKAIWDAKAKRGAGLEVDDTQPDDDDEEEDDTSDEEEAPPAPASTGKRKSVEPPKPAAEPPSDKKKKKKDKKAAEEPPAPAEPAPTPVSEKKKKKKSSKA